MELLAPDILEDSLRNELLALDILERERADSTVELLALVMIEYIREINYLHPSRQSLKQALSAANKAHHIQSKWHVELVRV